jgi:hypothetical protein
MTADFRLELVLIPASDVGRAKRFHVEQAGFGLLVDGGADLPEQRIVQVTAPGRRARSGSAPRSPPPRPARSRDHRASETRDHSLG